MKHLLRFCFVLISLPPAALAANLLVNRVWDHAPVIVYELPEADGRTEAIRYVETIRGRFKQGHEVIDAAANEQTLRTKLRNGFILYTTLGEKSKLLRLASRELGWQVTSGTFRWRDLAEPAGELKIILVGKNPYSKGYCAIYAAGSNRALVGINDRYHGGASYHVFQGDKLLKEGYYDERFLSVEHVSEAAALADVDQFFATLKRVHPNLLRNTSNESLSRLKQETQAGVASKLDSSGEISVEEFASLMFHAAAYFKDGHTFVDWWRSPNELNARGKRFPAFWLRFDNGRFVIAAAKDRTLVNMEAAAINGVPMVEFLRPILDRCSGETLGFRASRFLDEEFFWYNLTNLFGDGPAYRLKVRDAQGQYREAPLETLGFADYLDFRDQGGAEAFRPNTQGTKVEFFESGATAHFLSSSFRRSPEEKKNVDRAFEEVKAKGARNLILDLRGNYGGESDMAEHIFGYLYDGKFRVFSNVRAKVSFDILPQFPLWTRPIGAVLAGHVVSHSIGERAVRKPDAFFPGHTYLLVDNGSFSMAASFAAMFRDYRVGTIVGYETGGDADSFGGPHFFTLKNSRIHCAVAFTENVPSKPQAGDREHGVLPDVQLNEQKLADFRGEQDPVLAFTRQYVRSSGGVGGR